MVDIAISINTPIRYAEGANNEFVSIQIDKIPMEAFVCKVRSNARSQFLFKMVSEYLHRTKYKEVGRKKSQLTNI